MSAVEQAHHRLIDQLIGRGALWSPALIAAFRATPRHHFLRRFHFFQRDQTGWHERCPGDPISASDLRTIYADRAVTTRVSEATPDRPAVSISSSSQPSLMAQMLEDLRLAPGLRVLEIGAGTGYNAALLSHVVGRVVSLDVDQAVLSEAAENLKAFPERPVELVHADGREGWPGGGGPYDRIQVTASSPDLEPAWLAQLAAGGVVQAPLEPSPGLAFLVQGSVRDGIFEGRLTRPAYFMPLREEGSPGRGEGTSDPLPNPDRLSAIAAPWADWADHRTGGPGLPDALMFLGWLQGLAVAHRSLSEGRPVHGVADLVEGHACWFESRDWRVTGQAGEDLGRRLWQMFLDAGGPRPTEFHLTAWPREAGVAVRPSATARLSFVREGARTIQRWDLPEPRDRPEWA